MQRKEKIIKCRLPRDVRQVARAEDGQFRVVGAIYDIESGKVEFMNGSMPYKNLCRRGA